MKTTSKKSGLHPRNRHRGRYDFDQLAESCPELLRFLSKNKFNEISIDFANPDAVKALNKALLKHFYGVLKWDIPMHHLCPPIPGRADYLHHMADLMSFSNGNIIPRGKSICVLDVGVGANCIYPLIGQKEYGWCFVGSDIDSVALTSAEKIIKDNPKLADAIQVRKQTSSLHLFSGIIRPDDQFDCSISNPPFHASLREAQEGSRRKWKNLGKENARTSISKPAPVLNFGGQDTELWCPGGEAAFIHRMIEESALFPKSCFWFSTLVSKESNLPSIYRALKNIKPVEIRTIPMAQGQKKSRIVAWTFLNKSEQGDWKTRRWGEMDHHSPIPDPLS